MHFIRKSPEEARTAEEGVNQVREQARGGEDCRRGRKSGKRASPEEARTAEEGVIQIREVDTDTICPAFL